MMSPVDIVKNVYDSFSKGDLEGFIQMCDENIEWVVNGPASLEKCQSYRGREGVRQFLDILERTWTFRSFSANQYIHDGDSVVVLGDETGDDKATNQPFENRWAHVFDIKDDKVIRFREFLCHWSGNEHPPKMSK
ncbi:nuclear transport factor 2 family protein [Kistimonas asteriae]|uniref:nuclear transport factor 2 family protein n=1 Tax=Kistimonas asteriae TaxID=517724 RepID=UPI001BA444F8|nr:nuclear transport factor 2 family protein [Kistimonas asteriae]